MVKQDCIEDQLVDFYFKHDFKEFELSEPEVRNTIQVLLNKDRITYLTDSEGKLIGYVEVWLINADQLGRVICGEHLDVGKEDIEHGSIAYVANMTVEPQYRDLEVVEWLCKEGSKHNPCKHIVYHRRKPNNTRILSFRYKGVD